MVTTEFRPRSMSPLTSLIFVCGTYVMSIIGRPRVDTTKRINRTAERLRTERAREISPRPSRLSFCFSQLKPCSYFRRSFRLPFLSFMFPRRWSERPSRFVSLSPVREPAASFIRPFALSMAPSSLSCLPLLPTCSSSARECTLLYLPGASGMKHLLVPAAPETGDERWSVPRLDTIDVVLLRPTRQRRAS